MSKYPNTLEVSVTIMEGEKKYFEDKILELEAQKSTTNRQPGDLRTWVKELEVQNQSLETQLKTTNERNPDITPFHDQAFLIRRKNHQAKLKLAEEIYKVKQVETRLNEIAEKSLNFREGLLEVGKKFQS